MRTLLTSITRRLFSYATPKICVLSPFSIQPQHCDLLEAELLTVLTIMPCTRADLEARERQTLAPYAQFSADSRGRVHEEAPPEWRTHYQRDRDRVIHSRAFRRLEYKTHVFLNGSGDHFRTRLTHTMEVAGISRNIARALGLNEDLAEAIALAHDLGHSPFGHKGESVLNALMK